MIKPVDTFCQLNIENLSTVPLANAGGVAFAKRGSSSLR